MIEHSPHVVNDTDKEGNTILHYAAVYDDQELTECILKQVLVILSPLLYTKTVNLSPRTSKWVCGGGRGRGWFQPIGFSILKTFSTCSPTLNAYFDVN